MKKTSRCRAKNIVMLCEQCREENAIASRGKISGVSAGYNFLCVGEGGITLWLYCTCPMLL